MCKELILGVGVDQPAEEEREWRGRRAAGRGGRERRSLHRQQQQQQQLWEGEANSSTGDVSWYIQIQQQQKPAGVQWLKSRAGMPYD
jgi:hypothetical protein